MPSTIRFALNRICGARMPFAAFAAMAQRLGATAIELRNDLPAVEMRDQADPATIGAIAADHGLTIRAINALQGFDQLTAARQSAAAALAQYASACGAQALVLCPTNHPHDLRDPRQRHDDLVHALHGLQPVLAGHGLLGLIEPLGFAESALRRKSQARRAIDALGASTPFALVHDTFHHHLAGEPACYPQGRAGAHLGRRRHDTCKRRRCATATGCWSDRRTGWATSRNCAQLLADGYTGYVSFEPFADAVTQSRRHRTAAGARAWTISRAAVAASTGADGSSVR